MLVPAATALIHFGQLQTFPLPSLPPQVQKSAAHYTEAAQDEITLCSQIRDGDPLDDRCCVRMYDSFEHGGPHGRHTCMVFEVLGENLLALIKRYDYRGIPLPVVRNLSRQMLIGLDYIHRCVGEEQYRWGRRYRGPSEVDEPSDSPTFTGRGAMQGIRQWKSGFIGELYCSRLLLPAQSC